MFLLVRSYKIIKAPKTKKILLIYTSNSFIGAKIQSFTFPSGEMAKKKQTIQLSSDNLDLENLGCWLDSQIKLKQYTKMDVIDCVFGTNSAYFTAGSIIVDSDFSKKDSIQVTYQQQFIKFGDYNFENIQLNKEIVLITGSRLFQNSPLAKKYGREYDHLIYLRPQRGQKQPPISLYTAASLQLKKMSKMSKLTDSELILPFIETKIRDPDIGLRRRTLQQAIKRDYTLRINKYRISKELKIKIADFPLSLKNIAITLVNPFNHPVEKSSMLTTLLKIDKKKNRVNAKSWRFLLGFMLILVGFLVALFFVYRLRRRYLQSHWNTSKEVYADQMDLDSSISEIYI